MTWQQISPTEYRPLLCTHLGEVWMLDLKGTKHTALLKGPELFAQPGSKPLAAHSDSNKAQWQKSTALDWLRCRHAPAASGTLTLKSLHRCMYAVQLDCM